MMNKFAVLHVCNKCSETFTYRFYLRQSSVSMAVDILSGGYIRPSHQITVTRAVFSDKSSLNNRSDEDGRDNSTNNYKGNNKRAKMTTAQYRVAKSIMKNALGWNEDDGTLFDVCVCVFILV